LIKFSLHGLAVKPLKRQTVKSRVPVFKNRVTKGMQFQNM